MRRITLGLALSLCGGMALAQTPPATPPAPGAQTQPGTGTRPGAQPTQPGAPTQPGIQAQQAPTSPAPNPAVPTPNGPPEGMIVETPNGFYLVRPGDAAPHRLDLGQMQGRMPPGAAQAGRGGDMDGMGQPGDMGPMGDMADMPDGGMPDGGMHPPPPHPHRPPPRPPEGKGARFRIQAPNMTVGVKCPDDEPMKACVDAISQLLDKAAVQPH